MMQENTNRYEEYIALRAELLVLLTTSRQIMYITAAFLVASIGWYLGQPIDQRIAVSAFAVFLYVGLLLSAAIYLINTSQVYRIGGFLAVFWESRDPDRRLFWHRFNRRGPAGGFLPDAAMLVYTGSALTVVLLVAISAFTRQTRPFEPIAMIIVLGICVMIVFSQVNRYLHRERDRFEVEWRRIRGSAERRDAIHNGYETLPS